MIYIQTIISTIHFDITIEYPHKNWFLQPSWSWSVRTNLRSALLMRRHSRFMSGKTDMIYYVMLENSMFGEKARCKSLTVSVGLYILIDGKKPSIGFYVFRWMTLFGFPFWDGVPQASMSSIPWFDSAMDRMFSCKYVSLLLGRTDPFLTMCRKMSSGCDLPLLFDDCRRLYYPLYQYTLEIPIGKSL